MNYFVFKNGMGNSWSGLAEQHGHFYVGYDDEWQKSGSTVDLAPLPILNVKNDSLPDDLRNILLVSHPDNRERFTLLTFERETLSFWRVTDSVQRHEVGSPFWTTAKKLAEAKKATGSDQRMLTNYSYFRDDGCVLRTLPVDLIGKIRRNRLYTSIDSLSVYRYLNQGTCRPLWRIKGPSAAMLPSVITPTELSETHVEGSGRQETPFGAFARLYLNDVLNTLPGARATTYRGIKDLCGVDYGALVLATLNPILVETAALAFCQDLGLTPDIGVGKGIDVVDIRARAVRADGTFCERTASTALDRLRASKVVPSDALREALLTHGVLDIQCKAVDRVGGGNGVLYFGYRDVRQGTDELLVPQLREVVSTAESRPSESHLRRFLGMQGAILRGEWQTAFGASGQS